MSDMKDGTPVEIVPYDPSWPARFEAERRALVALFAPSNFTIEHIGSTSVPGLGAKPIIDIMLGCERVAAFEPLIPALERAGWLYLPVFEVEFPERRFLAKPQTLPRQVHLHAVSLDTPFWSRHLLFRDRLRVDPQVASSYEELKIELAERFRGDRDGYSRAKSEFIESVLGEVSP